MRSRTLFVILGALPFMAHCEEVEMEIVTTMEAPDAESVATMEAPDAESVATIEAPDAESVATMEAPEEYEPMADPEATEGAYEGMNPINEEQFKALFKLVDKDGDGKVKVSEFLDLYKARGKSLAQRDSRHVFASMDTNKDGKVSLAELSGVDAGSKLDEAMKKHVEFRTAQFKVADADGDGFLSEEEALTVAYPELHAGMLELGASQTIKDFDSNGDGTVDLDEFSHLGGSNATNEDKVEFKALDKNRDGKLDTEEFKVYEQHLHHFEIAMEEMVAAADQDADGVITLDELQHAREMLPGTNAHYHLEDFVSHYEL